jgi:FKBP-type peptidyl-prolyl cis-trans isomerase 2
LSKKVTKKTTKKSTKKTTKKSTKKKTETPSSPIVEQGDFIKLEFTGRIKETGAVFSTSDTEIAKKSNIFDEKTKYGPIPIVAGESFLLPGLDRQIIGLEVGKTSKILVPAEEAYGPRRDDLIQTFPVKRLKGAGIKPKKGEKIKSKDKVGTIVSIKQGRVWVDFNHELAGKDMEFEVKVLDKVEDEKTRIFLLVSRYIAALKEEEFHYEADEDAKSISLELPPFLLLTDGLQNTIIRLIGDLRQNFGYDKVEFKFKFDFSEISKEEKKLNETLTAPTPTPSQTDDVSDSDTVEKEDLIVGKKE